MIIITPAWHSQPWYPQLLEMSIQNPILLPKSLRKNSPFDNQQQPKVGDVESFRQRLSNSWISESAAKLITGCWRESSMGCFESAWWKWASWCAEKKVDSISCDVKHVLNFLVKLFEAGYQYRTINCHRSAISAYYNYIDGEKVGSHSEVCKLMTGIFNAKHPQPKYTFIWDVGIILDYIKDNWGDNSQLTIKELILKLTTLMALVSASRAIQINHLHLNKMARVESQYKFDYGKLHKGWRKGRTPPSLRFCFWCGSTNVCYKMLRWVFIEVWKVENKRPNPAIFRYDWTTQRSVKEVLTLSGVTKLVNLVVTLPDLPLPDLRGLSVNDIVERGSWSNTFTWQRFYHKKVIHR